MTPTDTTDGPVLFGPVTGDEPEFLRDVSNDRLVGAIIALAAELYIARDRNTRLERALIESGTLAPDALERTDSPESEAQQAELARFVGRILGELAGTRPVSGQVHPDVTRLLDPFPE